MKKRIINPAILLAFTLLGSCVSTVPALYVQEDFQQLNIDEIYLLPTADLRLDTSKQLNLDKWIHPVMRKQLKRKKYRSHSLSYQKMAIKITEEELANEQPAWLDSMKLEGVRWVLLPVLHDAFSKLTFGSSGNAEMSAMLYDLKNQHLIWRHKATGQVGQGGLAGMAMKGAMERYAIESASNQLAMALPVQQR